MTTLEYSALVFAVSGAAGFLGSLTGLGGGIVITPVLTLLMGVDLHYAMGATLVSVIATSSGAAAAYVKQGFSSVRIGMFLEIATTLGAIAGASLAPYVSASALAVIFGVVLLYSASSAVRAKHSAGSIAAHDSLAIALRLNGEYPGPDGPIVYTVRRVKAGFALMLGAGTLGGLLGLGSGPFKVIAMDQVMRIPFKVSTSTSNFMIGVTAAASAGVYLHRGYIDPGITMPVMLGVLVGASLGARRLAGASTHVLRIVFGLVGAVLATEMIYNGLKGALK